MDFLIPNTNEKYTHFYTTFIRIRRRVDPTQKKSDALNSVYNKDELGIMALVI